MTVYPSAVGVLAEHLAALDIPPETNHHGTSLLVRAADGGSLLVLEPVADRRWPPRYIGHLWDSVTNREHTITAPDGGGFDLMAAGGLALILAGLDSPETVRVVREQLGTTSAVAIDDSTPH